MSCSPLVDKLVRNLHLAFVWLIAVDNSSLGSREIASSAYDSIGFTRLRDGCRYPLNRVRSRRILPGLSEIPGF